MDIPLFKQLKRRQHVDLALLQDELVSVAYAISQDFVLHGGTAIWRCYGGKRFSEDLDFYCGKLPGNFKERLAAELDRRGLGLSKFRQSGSTVFARISNARIEASLEIALRRPAQKVVVQYEKTDGTVIDIFSIPAEELLKEKMSAFAGRKLIRDLYDVFFLSGISKNLGTAKADAEEFLANAPEPIDEKNLKTLVYSGVCPPAKSMLETVKRRFGL